MKSDNSITTSSTVNSDNTINSAPPANADNLFDNEQAATEATYVTATTGQPKQQRIGKQQRKSDFAGDRKVSVNFTDAEEREVKAKAAAAGVSIAELLRICAFRLTVVGRLTDFEREAIRELMYQGKNLNDQVKACQANAWPSTKRKAEACLDGILATLGKLRTSNSSLL